MVPWLYERIESMSTSADHRKEHDLSGLRLTTQRRAILRILRASTEHPEAGWIYEQVRKELPRISLGTVYRNLAQLAETGLVVELDVGRARRWDGQVKPHDHIVCLRCGTVEDLDVVYDRERLEEMASESSGFVAYSHQLHFQGLCPRCQREEALNTSAEA
jgi:Fur family transcriptional regulator, peroxide stress response regulator